MIGFGLTLSEVNLAAPTLDELYARVAERAAVTPEGGWVVGSGYDTTKIGTHPERDALDRAAPGRRVLLHHASRHMSVVNGLVLADLGIDDAAPPVSGGRVVTDADGRPTGLLQERAQGLTDQLLRPHPLPSLADAVARAGERYVSEGITSCTEAGIGGGWIGHSPAELDAYQRARETGRLHVRVELMVASDVLHPLGAHRDDGVDLGIDLGIRTGFGDDWLRVGAMKIFTDGSLGGRTAAMTEDWADDPCNHGFLQADKDALIATIVGAHQAGWQVAAHAIGDHGIDVALEAFTAAQHARPRPGARHRIEHFIAARPDQVTRAAGLGIVPVPQGRFVTAFGDGMPEAVGPDRVPWLCRQRSLIEAGMVLPGSSDRPVVEGAPLLGISSMVNRRAASGAPFNPGEAIGAEEALRAYTAGSAYASHLEHRKGSVTAGKLADLTVLSEDPTAVATDRIGGLEVLATIVDGEFKYDAGRFAG
jgi:hypothetical protein